MYPTGQSFTEDAADPTKARTSVLKMQHWDFNKEKSNAKRKKNSSLLLYAIRALRQYVGRWDGRQTISTWTILRFFTAHDPPVDETTKEFHCGTSMLPQKRMQTINFGKQLSAQQQADCENPIKSGELTAVVKAPPKAGGKKRFSYVRSYSKSKRLGKWWKFKNRPLLSSIRTDSQLDVISYFSFFKYYNLFLLISSIIGLFCFLYNAVTIDNDLSSAFCGTGAIGLEGLSCPACEGNCRIPMPQSECIHSKASYLFDNRSSYLYSLFMGLGAALTLKFGMRAYMTEKHTGKTSDIQEPQCAPSSTKYSSSGTCQRQIALLLFVVSFIVAVVFHAFLSQGIFYFYLYELADSKEITWLWATLEAALTNVTFVITFGFVYRYLALALTKLENALTQEQLERSYAIKLYLYQVVNRFSFIFYIAVVNGKTASTPMMKYFGLQRDTLKYNGTLLDLSFQAAVLVLCVQISRILEAVWKLHKRRKSRTESEVGLLPDELTGPTFELPSDCTITNNCVELMLQFTFVSLFAPTMPLIGQSVLLSDILIWNLEARDYLLMDAHGIPARPVNFSLCLSVMKAAWSASIFVNAAILAFSSDFVPKSLREFNGDILHNPLSGCSNYINVTSVPTCRYSGYRNACNPVTKVNCSKGCEALWWTIFAARAQATFLFVVIMAITKAAINISIPDIPTRAKRNLRVKAIKLDSAEFSEKCSFFSGNSNNQNNVTGRAENIVELEKPEKHGSREWCEEVVPS